MVKIKSESEEQSLLKIIGSYVKHKRLQRNISQVDLADLSGISVASITRFETGKGNISLQNLTLLLDILGLSEELKKYFLARNELGDTSQSRVRWSKKISHLDN